MNLEEECYRVDLQLVGPKDGYQLLSGAAVLELGSHLLACGYPKNRDDLTF